MGESESGIVRIKREREREHLGEEKEVVEEGGGRNRRGGRRSSK